MTMPVLLGTLVAVCLVAAQTTTTPKATTQATTHVTKEHNEHANMLFYYNGRTHHMIYKKDGHQCYVADLSDAERHAIHLDGGVRAVELRMIASLFIATSVDKSTLDHRDVQTCLNKVHNQTLMEFYKM